MKSNKTYARIVLFLTLIFSVIATSKAIAATNAALKNSVTQGGPDEKR